MIKKIRRFIVLVMICIIGLFSFIMYNGYKDYRSYEDVVPIASLMEKVKAKQEYVPHEDLPEYLLKATVAAEDKRFYKHGGVDLISLVRAVASQFNFQLAKSGGSTITQQLAKNLYGQYSTNVRWKLMEFFFANKLESLYTKEEILTAYVNVINYGGNNQGIYEACKNYYGVYPNQLGLGECSLLAGIPQSPANYDLYYHYENAKTRQQYVLDSMVKAGYITQEEADNAYISS